MSHLSPQHLSPPSHLPYIPSAPFTFAPQPGQEDYHLLARHIEAATQDRLHSSLWPRRGQVAQSLQGMGGQPERRSHRAAYQALRLLVW